MSRYYPGFLAAFFIVLLRIAIGWHFLYEGCEKVEGTLSGEGAVLGRDVLCGRDRAVWLVFPRDAARCEQPGVARPEASQGEMDRRRERDRPTIMRFTQTQRDEAQKILDESLHWADFWFDDPDNVEKIKKYYHDLGQVLANEHDRHALSFETERAWDARRSVEADRRT